MNYLLSVIIPTKNRYTTLFPVIDSILLFDDKNEIEIIIQDNSDDNSVAVNFMKERERFENLKYFHQYGNLSVIENSDKAVLNSTSEYVCFIGDDDGIMPYILDVVKWMKVKGYEAVKSFMPNYYWPNQRSNILSNDVSGNLKIKNFDYKSKIINCKEALQYTLGKGGTNMKMLPCLYHGIISRTSLDKIYNKCHSFFPGPSPDMANAIALTQVINFHVWVSFPVIISGKSSSSTGGAGVLHKHIAKIEDVKHLPKNTSLEWTDKIPKFWTGPTIWAESVLKALKHFENNEEIKKFNFSYLYAFISVFNKKHIHVIYKDFKYKRFGFRYFFYYLKIYLNRITIFIDNRLNSKRKIFRNVENIGAAIKIIGDEIKMDLVKSIIR